MPVVTPNQVEIFPNLPNAHVLLYLKPKIFEYVLKSYQFSKPQAYKGKTIGTTTAKPDQIDVNVYETILNFYHLISSE